MKFVKLFSIVFILSLLVQPLSAFGKKDKAEESSKPATEENQKPAVEEKIQDDFISIDLLLDTKKQSSFRCCLWGFQKTQHKVF